MEYKRGLRLYDDFIANDSRIIKVLFERALARMTVILQRFDPTVKMHTIEQEHLNLFISKLASGEITINEVEAEDVILFNVAINLISTGLYDVKGGFTLGEFTLDNARMTTVNEHFNYLVAVFEAEKVNDSGIDETEIAWRLNEICMAITPLASFGELFRKAIGHFLDITDEMLVGGIEHEPKKENLEAFLGSLDTFLKRIREAQTEINNFATNRSDAPTFSPLNEVLDLLGDELKSAGLIEKMNAPKTIETEDKMKMKALIQEAVAISEILSSGDIWRETPEQSQQREKPYNEMVEIIKKYLS